MANEPHLRFAGLHAALKAAAESTRLRVLALIAETELTVSDLTDILRQSQPRISRHLRLLVEAGLIERYREGNWAFFRRPCPRCGGPPPTLPPRPSSAIASGWRRCGRRGPRPPRPISAGMPPNGIA